MMKGGHGQTNQLHDIDWGALDHASHAPQLISCNYHKLGGGGGGGEGGEGGIVIWFLVGGQPIHVNV